MARTKRKTTKKPIYEPLLKLPPLSHEEYTGLHDSIAVNGVWLPILVNCDGPRRKIIDGNHRKLFADEFGYDCPEIVLAGLDEQEMRTMARALNLARRQMNTEQKRQLIRDQLIETPEKTNRVVAKLLGVSHPTVASVRGELESVGKIYQLDRHVGHDGKTYKTTKAVRAVRPDEKIRPRPDAVTLIHGDCRSKLKNIASKSVDVVLCDPIYPGIGREYGRVSEDEWLALMRETVKQCRRILKAKGSAVFIIQPNFDTLGKMRLWAYDFVAWAGREWNLVQDAYWWCVNAMPTRATYRTVGLMRQSVKWCIWLGAADCFRNQNAVLWEPSDATTAYKLSDRCLLNSPSGHTVRHGRTAQAALERGGSTPFNVLPIPSAGPAEQNGHPASTPYELAAWWCRYLLPKDGVLLDPMCGSGSILAAALDQGASKVIGIDKEKRYFQMAERQLNPAE